MTGAFGYELVWTGHTDTGRVLAGLTDPDTLTSTRATTTTATATATTTDADRGDDVTGYDGGSVGASAAVVGPWPGAGRGPVGTQPDPLDGDGDVFAGLARAAGGR